MTTNNVAIIKKKQRRGGVSEGSIALFFFWINRYPVDSAVHFVGT